MRIAFTSLALAVGLGVFFVATASAGSETRTIIKKGSDEVGVKMLKFEVEREDDSEAKKAADEARRAKDRAQDEQDQSSGTEN